MHRGEQSAFWTDHRADMTDPVYRDAYERATAYIKRIDDRYNRPDKDTPDEQQKDRSR